MKRRSVSLIVIGLFSLCVLPILAQDDALPAPVGLRPDAPAYAMHGPYWVGTQEFVNAELERPLPMTVWYPAANPDGVAESVVYAVEPPWRPLPDVDTIVNGHALSDAPPDMTAAPYPLIVLSHGGVMYPAEHAYLAEHLASEGFVVIAPAHGDVFDLETFVTLDLDQLHIERPRDVTRSIDYAETLTAPDGALAGMIDLEHVAVAGHSFGGYTALAAGGAQIDMNAFVARCEAARAAGDPNAWLCDGLDGFGPAFAEASGLEAVPEGLLPSWGDPRIDAIVSMAGDSYLFGATGLAQVTLPILALGGRLDSSTPVDWGVIPTYDDVSSETKALVLFEDAEHGIFMVNCDDQPWWIDMGFYGFCADAVWDKDRAHDLTNHFVTAFMLDTLKGDADTHAALAPDAVAFPGITYTAQGY